MTNDRSVCVCVCVVSERVDCILIIYQMHFYLLLVGLLNIHVNIGLAQPCFNYSNEFNSWHVHKITLTEDIESVSSDHQYNIQWKKELKLTFQNKPTCETCTNSWRYNYLIKIEATNITLAAINELCLPSLINHNYCIDGILRVSTASLQ